MGIVMRAAGLAALVGLAACAGDRREFEIAERAQTRLVGMPKAELLSCAGVPSRQAVVNGAEYYTYAARPVAMAPGAVAPGAVSEAGMGAAIGVDTGSNPTIGVPTIAGRNLAGCDVTFVLGGGAVRQVSYPMGANLEDCGAVVAACMAR